MKKKNMVSMIIISLLFCLITGFFVFGSGCYVLSQGAGLFDAYSGSVKVEKALKKNDLTEAEKILLENSLDIRTFAVDDLGLKENRNYSVFKKTDKEYLADVVSACAPYEFKTYYWDYPILGKLPYKGFFKRKDAEAEVERLKKKGLDVILRKVDAFSTLGFFTDPIFSFMSSYPLSDLADVIVHELTHATVFIKGQAEFNENLASFIGEKGAEAYLIRRYGRDSEEVAQSKNYMVDLEAYRTLLRKLIEDLEKVYELDLDDSSKADQKQQVLADFSVYVSAHYGELFLTENFRGLSSMKINNAYLSMFLNYNSGLTRLQSLYDESGLDLKGFISVLKKIPANISDPYGWLDENVLQSAESGPSAR